VPKIYDCYMLYDATVGFSDHCPIVLVIEMP
jgi:exonuclease III